MKVSFAFFKKEMLEQLRSGRLLILGLVFVMFGIMNPAVAKLTPWLLEVMADSMAESGMNITVGAVTAMDSWVQFFKNIPMALILFVLLQSGIFTKEYQSGTLILSLTKGLARYKVFLAKAAVVLLLWSVGYWLCFGVTYAYNAYFWDNAIAQNLLFSAVAWWVFGLWVLALMVLFSAVARSNVGVLCGTGGVVTACYLLGLLPKCSKFPPTLLANGNSLIYGHAEPKDTLIALFIAIATALGCVAAGLITFNKKQL